MISQDLEEKCLQLSDEDFGIFIVDLQLRVMDAILEKKMEDGKIVFSEVEDGLLN